MRIRLSQLRQIIAEETRRALDEGKGLNHKGTKFLREGWSLDISGNLDKNSLYDIEELLKPAVKSLNEYGVKYAKEIDESCFLKTGRIRDLSGQTMSSGVEHILACIVSLQTGKKLPEGGPRGTPTESFNKRRFLTKINESVATADDIKDYFDIEKFPKEKEAQIELITKIGSMFSVIGKKTKDEVLPSFETLKKRLEDDPRTKDRAGKVSQVIQSVKDLISVCSSAQDLSEIVDDLKKQPEKKPTAESMRRLRRLLRDY
jgi:hypothetical protein